MSEIRELDPVIHAPVRLAVLTILLELKSADFNYLKETTKASDGNLSTHLTKLESAGYIKVTKKFVGKRPRTTCSITQKGIARFEEYIRSLETYVGGIRKRT